jgi:prepilin-type N-terminal cleavage/methylation domain-containing protein
MRRRGLSLIEVLVVVAIVALLVAILVPVFNRAKKEASVASATTEGREVAMALLMYADSNEGLPRRSLDTLVESGHLSSPRIMKVAGDPYPLGYYGQQLDCWGGGSLRPIKNAASYEYLFLGPGSVEQYLAVLERHDPNHGILALRVLGQRNSDVDPTRCGNVQVAFVGPMLRFRKDGSVQRARYEPVTLDGVSRYYYLAKFTDVREAWSLKDLD